MKLIIREKQLNEVGLNVSQTLVKDGYDFIMDRYFNIGIPQDQVIMDIPIKELLAGETKPLLIGAAMVYEKLVMGSQINGNQKLKKLWLDEQKDFPEGFKKILLTKKFPVYFAYQITLPNRSAGLAAIIPVTKISMPALIIGLDAHKDETKLPLSIRHEAQHVTQLFGSMCLYYYELLKRAKFNFDTIQEPRVILGMNEFDNKNHDQVVQLKRGIGLGKRKTNVQRYPRPERKDFASDEEYKAAEEKWLENYFSTDVEFETWTSDLAEEYVKFLVDSTNLQPVEAIAGYIIEKYPMLASSRIQEAVTPELIRVVREFADGFNLSYERARQVLKKSKGLNELTIELVNDLITNKSFMDSLTSYAGDRNFEVGLPYILKARPKEARQEIISKVKQEIVKTLEKNFPFVLKI